MTMPPLTRRDLLRFGACAAASAALPARMRAATAAPTAKTVIQIWLWGGPSHLDTFDPKPDAGDAYCGPYKSPIATNVPGIRICEKLPMLARQADKYSIIRSMTHGINAHETASYAVQTGRAPGRLVYPCAGAVVSRFRGGADYRGLVPPYIVLTQTQGRFSEAGFLGPRYKPFATGGDPNRDPFAVEGIVAEGITDKRQRARRGLLHNLDTLGRRMPETPEFAALDRTEQEAYKLMFGDARTLFDLTTEPDTMREAYGRNTFGQACLTARRLAEHGVPYITINYRGWDTHKQHFQAMDRMLPEMDRGVATLLQDLSQRGLLDSTVIWWGGEFGRGPKIQWEPPWNGGRSHFGACFSVMVAGGGFRGGQVIGASDGRGMEVAERPVKPAELIAAIYEKLGIDPAGALPNDRGLEVAILPADTGRLHEIM